MQEFKKVKQKPLELKMFKPKNPACLLAQTNAQNIDQENDTDQAQEEESEQRIMQTCACGRKAYGVCLPINRSK